MSEKKAMESLPRPASKRWQLLRAGLQNVWEYDDQRFVFHRGRLLLRGANESGKTKAMEVLLPFLLDADLAPQRLDPFGSTSRPMRWNLLNDDNPEVEISIGYVWLEFGRQQGGKEDGGTEFCTIGAGLRAKRANKDVDVWYFITSQRVDDELHLLGERRVPLVESRLVEAIGPLGRVFDRAGEYRRKVNERLFRMPQEQYDTLIDALLQLRRPKLSERLDPDELSRLLTGSLPPLESRVVGALAEGFERLDRHRTERAEFARTVASVRDFLGVYRQYLSVVAKGVAQGLTTAESAYQRSRLDLRDKEQEHEDAKTAQALLAEQIGQLETQEIVVDQRLNALRSSDAYKSIQELEDVEQAARRQAEHAVAAGQRWERERQFAQELHRKRDHAKDDLAVQERALAVRRAAASAAAVEAVLDREHRAIDGLIEASEITSAERTLRSLVERRTADIGALAIEVDRTRRAVAAAQKAEERLEESSSRVRDAESRLVAAEEGADEAEVSYRDDVDQWFDSLEVLRPPAGERAALLALSIDAMRSEAENLAEPTRTALDTEVASLATTLNQISADIGAAEADRDALAAATHRPPSAPAWRSPREADRPGAPFYLLCDFSERVTEGRAGLEAALESSGLLDAWVTPDGRVLDPQTFDVVWTQDPQDGPTVADVLIPAEGSGVEPEVMGRILRTLPLVAAGAAPPSRGSWISMDGRWRLGPVQGAWQKAEPAYIGTSARESARWKRLAELEEILVVLRERDSETQGTLAAVRGQRTLLQQELLRFPDLKAVLQAQAAVKTAAAALAGERDQHEIAGNALNRARDDVREALAARDAQASATGLLAWVDSLDTLRQRTFEYKQLTLEVVSQAATCGRLRSLFAERAQEATSAQERATLAGGEAEEARREAVRTETRASTLRGALGATRQEILSRLARDELELGDVRGLLRKRREEKATADGLAGRMEGQVATAREVVEVAENARRGADERFKAFARRGHLAVLDSAAVMETPDSWSLRDALIAARAVDAATEAIAYSQEARDAADTRVSQKHRDLERLLPHQVRIFGERVEGIVEYRTAFHGRPRALLELVADLDGEVAAHDRLLDEQESELFESFLTGETHQHLRARLRQARNLVNRMNSELEKRPTSSGMILKLLWDVREDAPAGAPAAIDLLLRSGHLLSDNDRAALRKFLEQRLDEAHTEDAAAGLEDRMLKVLDYRLWFSFTVQVKMAGQGWTRLTRKRHAAGSGGQKGVMLQLPLFAAAAAFYESAHETAPRLIMLDEAFSGIDRRMRGKLMGLLAEFELDFVMTSFEEWGFYEELDGLSTYHLAREQGMRGVYADWFVWDGKQATQMST